MRVLVVGAGVYVTGRGTNGLGTVLPALAEASRHLGIEGVVVAATRVENAEVVVRTAEQANARLGTRLDVRYENYSKDLLARARHGSFDCAIVAVPDPLHERLGLEVLEAGLHVLMVKPFAPTLAAALRLEKKRSEMKVYGMVEFHKRWDEANLIARRLIAERALGGLSYIDVEYSQRRTVPLEHFRAWAADTNIFQYLGVHYVDLVYFLTGFSPSRAMAVGTRGILDSEGIDTWDSVHATVEWQPRQGGAPPLLTRFSTNWVDSTRSSAISDQKFRIVGERGRLECDQKNRGMELTTEESGVEAVNPYFSQFLLAQDPHQRFSGYGYRSFATFLEDVAAIQGGRSTAEALQEARPSFRQSLVSTAVVDAVNRSLAARGEWREVDDPSR